jgi:glucokinase
MSENEPQHPASMPLAAGIEIAESATRFTLTSGDTPQSRRWCTRLDAPASPSQAVDAIASLLDRARQEYRPDAAAQATPSSMRFALGVALADAEVDAGHGIVRTLRRAPGWENIPFAERLAERTGATVRLASATNAAAVAEARIGAGQGLDPVLYILLVRTITSSLVVGGRYLAGADGGAGQLGHWLVRSDGPRCACGAYGHLDPIASAQSLVRNLIGRASDSDESTAAMLRVTGGRAEAMTAAQVALLASEGDPAARAVLDDALDTLASALANLVAALAPAAIIIGGPLAAAGEGFFAPLIARLDALCRSFSRVPDLHPGALEPMAAALGARLLSSDAGVLQ